MLTPMEKDSKQVWFFMHGLCHTTALEINNKYNLPLIVVTDIDDGMEILTHVGNVLPNRMIIDAKGIYTEKEFKAMLEDEFEELTEFNIKIHRKPTKLLLHINNELPITDFKTSDKYMYEFFNYIVDYTGVIINDLQYKANIQKITKKNKQFAENHKEDVRKLLKNKDNYLRDAFKNKGDNLGKILGYTPKIIENKDKKRKINTIYLTPFSCYIIIDNNVLEYYSYKKQPIKDINKLMATLIQEGYLPKEYIKYTKAMYLR